MIRYGAGFTAHPLFLLNVLTSFEDIMKKRQRKHQCFHEPVIQLKDFKT